MDNKKEFLESLEYYIEFLLFDRDEIFELSMIGFFHIDRSIIDQGVKKYKYEISDKQKANLFKADIAFMKDLKEVLIWWERDGIFDLREQLKHNIEKEQWYWWLDEIADGSYPIEMIPEHLKEVCKDFYN